MSTTLWEDDVSVGIAEVDGVVCGVTFYLELKWGNLLLLLSIDWLIHL